MGTKEKSKVTRKKPMAVTGPQNMRTLEDWINLESEVLEKSCKAVKLPANGTLREMARSLMQFYRRLDTHGYPDTHGTSTGSQLRTRLTGLCSGIPAVFSDPITPGEVGIISQLPPTTTTNRYIPSAEGQIDLGGELTAVFNQRDPLSLDVDGLGNFDPLNHNDIGRTAHTTIPAPFDPMAIIPVIPPNGEETAQDVTIALTHDPTTGPPAITTGTEGRPVTLGDIRDIMTHSMREFQHSIQQMVTQQIETQIRSAIPIPSLPPSSSQLHNNQNARSLPTQPRRSAPLNADLLDAQMLTSFPQTASSVRISRLPTRLLGQIARGEFVNFGILLTASTSGIADPPMTATVQQGSESSQAVCLPTAEAKNAQLFLLAGGVEHIPHIVRTLSCVHDTTTASIPDHHHKVQPIIPSSCMEGIRHAVQTKQSERSHIKVGRDRRDHCDRCITHIRTNGEHCYYIFNTNHMLPMPPHRSHRSSVFY